MRAPIFALALLWVMPVQAQISVAAGSGLAHDCYIAAKAPRRLRENLQTCSAALEHGGISVTDRAATLVNRGVLYDAMKDYPAAWTDYNAALRLDPRLGDAYVNRGAALMRMQRSGDGLEDIRKGLSLGTSLPQVAYYDLGVAEENLGRLKDAYFDYKRALAADPGYKPAADALKFFKVENVKVQ